MVLIRNIQLYNHFLNNVWGSWWIVRNGIRIYIYDKVRLSFIVWSEILVSYYLYYILNLLRLIFKDYKYLIPSCVFLFCHIHTVQVETSTMLFGKILRKLFYVWFMTNLILIFFENIKYINSLLLWCCIKFIYYCNISSIITKIIYIYEIML